MTDKPAPATPSHVRPSDLRATARLATQATLGTSRIVEGVHQCVWRTLGAPGGAEPDRARGLTGLVYRCVNGITRAAGKGLDVAPAARTGPAALRTTAQQAGGRTMLQWALVFLVLALMGGALVS